MSVSNIDLSQLPAPDIVETLDYENILDAMLKDVRKRAPEFNALVESDPAYKLLEVAAYREVLLRSRINQAARAVMLPYARGADLDNLGALYRTTRHTIKPADNTKTPPVPAVFESDKDYRRRLYLAWEGLSNAGTRDSYTYHALKSLSSIQDATASSPEKGKVLITVLSRTAPGTVSAEQLATVNAYMQKPEIRQVTDLVTIESAKIINYKINATLHVLPGPGANIIKKTAEKELGLYVEERRLIGQIIPVSGIYRILQQEGVVRVDLESPTADIKPKKNEAGYCSAIALKLASHDS
ncbi:MAG: baseplate J/gp47 family protein [Flavobacteriales bacterium]